ncbi:MAG: glutamine--tRNA ligase [marine bacterium B5-7]|nr:MAG: glutamine--tRNA ligase [marine bacterium B5-7]
MTTKAHTTNFIKNRIDADVAAGKNGGQVVTRFPPEPNGYLHIGHAKSICLNFTTAVDYSGVCHLRMDDTNPLNEKDEYIDAIQRDVQWLGFEWGKHVYFASDYYQQLYDIAVHLIKEGKAFVCSLSADQMRETRGTLTEPGTPSPDRDRSVEDNLDFFARMRADEFEEGQYILRAKIDMAAPNMNLRDPALYRIRKVSHHRTGDAWCIYPMYDYAHALSDAIEGITHSLCTLEFQDHRPLYDWIVEHSGLSAKPQQIEFSRLNLNYTITSKRKLKQLVDSGAVSGWNDPRMPTISGVRRRGYPAKAIRSFCEHIGVSKQDSIIDFSILENHVRDVLNVEALRRMAVLDPIKVIITNYPEDETNTLSVPNHPQDEIQGRRDLTFSRELYIDREDFSDDPPPKYMRLTPEKEVRLMNAYAIKVVEVIKDADGQVQTLHCTYDADTLGGQKPKDGRKIKGVIHWVSAYDAVDAEVRVYERLFNVENPASLDDFMEGLNPDALRVISHAKVEPAVASADAGQAFQFNRIGYFCTDSEEHQADKPVFNRIVSLKEGW